MIEIAMSLAIIGFALVVIIGVLPKGMDVQKNNRRETIINQDAKYFIEAIRGGARGLDDLTNYVEAITVPGVGTYTNPNLPTPAGLTSSGVLTSGQMIIGLLSTPNTKVTAYVKALSGAAIEKAPQNNPTVNEAAFSYRMVSEITAPPSGNLLGNLHEVRLLFRWPLLPTGDTGSGRQVYRLMIAGALSPVNDSGKNLFFFQPQTFTNAP
jgi:type II secretory pathway pseudopilin PulG